MQQESIIYSSFQLFILLILFIETLAYIYLAFEYCLSGIPLFHETADECYSFILHLFIYFLCYFLTLCSPVILLSWQYLMPVDVHDGSICLFAKGFLVSDDFIFRYIFSSFFLMDFTVKAKIWFKGLFLCISGKRCRNSYYTSLVHISKAEKR
jgi:hypothetical protein